MQTASSTTVRALHGEAGRLAMGMGKRCTLRYGHKQHSDGFHARTQRWCLATARVHGDEDCGNRRCIYRQAQWSWQMAAGLHLRLDIHLNASTCAVVLDDSSGIVAPATMGTLSDAKK